MQCRTCAKWQFRSFTMFIQITQAKIIHNLKLKTYQGIHRTNIVISFYWISSSVTTWGNKTVNWRHWCKKSRHCDPSWVMYMKEKNNERQHSCWHGNEMHKFCLLYHSVLPKFPHYCHFTLIPRTARTATLGCINCLSHLAQVALRCSKKRANPPIVSLHTFPCVSLATPPWSVVSRRD